MEIHIDTDIQPQLGFHTGSGSDSELIELDSKQKGIMVNFKHLTGPPVDIFDVKPMDAEYVPHRNHRIVEGI